MGKYLTKTGLTKYTTKLKEYISKAKVASAASADNAIKVNGHTVNTDVPVNAKFTDTIYTHPNTHPASMITGLPTKVSQFENDKKYQTEEEVMSKISALIDSSPEFLDTFNEIAKFQSGFNESGEFILLTAGAI